LALYRTETVTIMAVVIIGAILAVYLIVLKRNGWLDRSDQFYRCPNPQCRKIFRKPAEVKDLSETPGRVYQGCPECGADLEQYPANEQTHDMTPRPECKYFFGYLSSHDKKEAIPETCLKCPSSLNCMLDNQSKDPFGARAKAFVQNSILRYI
jgi:predicted  nucleic acid-binding Zn-ribbon protein